MVNPRSLHGQMLGGINLGIGHALQQKWVYDPQYGVPLAKRFHHNKPLTILDIPAEMHTEALGLRGSGNAGRRARRGRAAGRRRLSGR